MSQEDSVSIFICWYSFIHEKKQTEVVTWEILLFLAHMKAQNVDMDRAVKLVVQELTVTPFVFVLIYTLIYYNY